MTVGELARILAAQPNPDATITVIAHHPKQGMEGGVEEFRAIEFRPEMASVWYDRTPGDCFILEDRSEVLAPPE